MSTYTELADRVRLVADNAGINLSIDVENLVREAENIFIAESFCTEAIDAISTSVDGLADTYDLPDDFVKEFRVTWNGISIDPLHQRSDVRLLDSANTLITGTPIAYWIEDEQVRLIPKPSSDGYFHLWYCKRNTSTSGTSPIIPVREHIKLVDYVLYVLFEMDGNDRKATHYEEKFYAMAAAAKIHYQNQRFKQYSITDVLGELNTDALSIQNRIGLVSE